MTRSLKERYESQRLVTLKEQIVDVEQQLLAETKVSLLLIEAMDQEDLDKVSKVVDKLERIKGAVPGLPSLQKGIDAAQTELNKYTAGGPISKAWSKLKGKLGVDNPVVKITTFANALERGFGQLPQILKMNGVDTKALKDSTDMTLQDAIVKQFVKSPDYTADMLKKSVPNKKAANVQLNAEADGDITSSDVEANAKAEKDAQGKIKTLVTQLRKALSPGGIFGVFKKVPYVDMDALTRELMTTAKLSELLGVYNAVKSGPQTSEFASDIKQNVSGGGGQVGTDASKPSEETKSTGQSTGTEPSQPSAGAGSPPAETGSKNPEQGSTDKKNVDPAKVAAAVGKKLQQLFSQPNVDTAKLGKMLMDAGLSLEALKAALKKS